LREKKHFKIDHQHRYHASRDYPFFLSIKADPAAVPPIGANIADYARVADPVPQALMITAIVVGISVTALSLTMFVNLHHKYGSSNWNKVKRKRRDID